jgi:hypothetical protein
MLGSPPDEASRVRFQGTPTENSSRGPFRKTLPGHRSKGFQGSSPVGNTRRTLQWTPQRTVHRWLARGPPEDSSRRLHEWNYQGNLLGTAKGTSPGDPYRKPLREPLQKKAFREHFHESPPLEFSRGSSRRTLKVAPPRYCTRRPLQGNPQADSSRGQVQATVP